MVGLCLAGSMFDWNDLRYFLDVARKGTLSAAGNRLGVDHTTVSRRITALEGALGTKLFTRHKRSYILTDEGRTLMKRAEDMENLSHSLMDDVNMAGTGPSGTVRLATPEAFGSQFLSPRLLPLYQQYPGVELELVAETRHLSLSRREADISVAISKPTNDRLHFAQIGAYRLNLYAAPAYLQKSPPILRQSHLNGHQFVWYIEDLLPVNELRQLGRFMESQHIAFHSTSVTAQASAAENGVGIALLPCFVADTMKGLTRVLPQEISVTLPLWLVIHRDLRDIPRYDVVYRFLADTIKAHTAILQGIKQV